MTASLEQLRRCTAAIDLGASRTRVYLKNVGLVVDEPSVAAVDCHTGSLVAVGETAERMTGRTPEHIRVIRPISGGAVVDIDMAQRMLRHLLGDRLSRAWRRKPMLRAAMCVPSGSEPMTQRAAIETLTGLGARRVELVDTLIAAAVGCGLPVEYPEATMIVVCGATTTHVAVLSLGAIVAADTVQVGGEVIDRAMLQHLRNQHALLLPGQSVRSLHGMLETSGGGGPATVEVHGMDASSATARSIRVEAAGMRLAIEPTFNNVLDGIRAVLRRCPPDLVADLGDRGIMLAGGSARLPGLDTVLREGTGMPVTVSEHPGSCSVRGLGAMLEGRATPMALESVSFAG
ncbi:rod shape-determining protein [Streptomyces sp. SL13]|jgi:rod shape-determining protein MreB|uniref:Cell shape-determining protein MreB n=1 Tax=Streptantibioticus silvisoli TaxID=2705255 RepID=A0AA90H7U6_9ACTN|nr:rod shape-determining protein [Streptantibioticus silvisoli]MDI5963707.1 rod shape-determining protein [Streptantibioticus silvisoli]MDI5969547.1 rod shape-determining protein [Streptantibioticus silvisoli]